MTAVVLIFDEDVLRLICVGMIYNVSGILGIILDFLY